jgi:mono/diheme cytochrome c family protein
MKKIITTVLLITLLILCLSAENPVHPSIKNSIARGKKIYKMYCLTCHQQDGSGVPDMNPPLIKSPYVNGSKTTLIKRLLHGSKDAVDIDGETYSRPMPPFGSVLKDQQIADVLTYVRNSFGNKATPAYITLVRKVRLQVTKP